MPSLVGGNNENTEVDGTERRAMTGRNTVWSYRVRVTITGDIVRTLWREAGVVLVMLVSAIKRMQTG